MYMHFLVFELRLCNGAIAMLLMLTNNDTLACKNNTSYLRNMFPSYI